MPMLFPQALRLLGDVGLHVGAVFRRPEVRSRKVFRLRRALDSSSKMKASMAMASPSKRLRRRRASLAYCALNRFLPSPRRAERRIDLRGAVRRRLPPQRSVSLGIWASGGVDRGWRRFAARQRDVDRVEIGGGTREHVRKPFLEFLHIGIDQAVQQLGVQTQIFGPNGNQFGQCKAPDHGSQMLFTLTPLVPVHFASVRLGKLQ